MGAKEGEKRQKRRRKWRKKLEAVEAEGRGKEEDKTMEGKG